METKLCPLCDKPLYRTYHIDNVNFYSCENLECAVSVRFEDKEYWDQLVEQVNKQKEKARADALATWQEEKKTLEMQLSLCQAIGREKHLLDAVKIGKIAKKQERKQTSREIFDWFEQYTLVATLTLDPIYIDFKKKYLGKPKASEQTEKKGEINDG